jgi:Ca-activated chloride channel family protein
MHVVMRPIVWVLGACALLSCAAGGIAAQEPELFRGSPAELVVLSVVVNDRRGREVPRLTREQFTVYDNNLPQPIALFDSGDEPVSVVLLIDVLGELVIATLAFARASNPADELYTIAFNEEVVESAGGRSIHAADAAQLESELRTLRADGQTALYDGLNVGLDRLEHSTQTRRILLLISDGGDNASKRALGDILARAKRANVAIYTIGLFDKGAADQNPKVLKSLAQATGGQRYLPSSPSALLGICERIAREIRSGYTIAFTPPMPDGLYHELRVVVSPGPDRLVARTRPGYTAAGGEHRDRDVR